MKFLDPTSDIAFKKLFGDQAKADLLISFLNCTLKLKEGEKIKSVVLTNPYNQPDTDWLKLSIVDVRCTDQRDRNYIVEVQVDREDDYPERSQYYAALAIARQLKVKGVYGDVKPVFFIGILDFKVFDTLGYYHHHQTLNVETYQQELKLIEFFFIELPKFNKNLDQLKDDFDRWIYLLQNAGDMDRIPQQLKSSAVLEDAMETLKEGALSSEELAEYDRFVHARRVAEGVRNTNIRIGREEGREEGREVGKAEERFEIAQKMLADGVSVEKVAHFTQLSVEQINDLRKKK